jgi:hypothetical protein
MPRRNSITSFYCAPPVFDGLSVRQRVDLLNSTLPAPTTVEEAAERVEAGLYAVGELQGGCIGDLWRRQKFSGKTPLKFWSEIAAETESQYQGNIGPVLAKKLHRITEEGQKAEILRLTEAAWNEATRCGYNTDERFYIRVDPFAGLEEQIESLRGILKRLESGAA